MWILVAPFIFIFMIGAVCFGAGALWMKLGLRIVKKDDSS